MAKAPAFQFYPGDWLRDAGLRSCSIGARGLWIDMICYMHGGTPYGYLKVGEKVIRVDNLASMVGDNLDKVAAWLEELRQAEVFSVDDNGAIYSRRMVRDENLRKTRAECGKLGGNPKLLDNQNPTTKDKQPSNQKPTPASASASASSSASSIAPAVKKDLAATPRDESSTPKPPRPRNELWDAVANEFFGGTVTSVHEGQVAKVVKDLKTLGATPASIKRRIKNYRLHMPNAICTPTALVKHWPLCANEPLQPGQAPPRTDEEWDRLITEAWEQDNGPDLVRRAKEKAALEQAAKEQGGQL